VLIDEASWAARPCLLIMLLATCHLHPSLASLVPSSQHTTQARHYQRQQVPRWDPAVVVLLVSPAPVEQEGAPPKLAQQGAVQAGQVMV
jgi:hypothetical protein